MKKYLFLLPVLAALCIPASGHAQDNVWKKTLEQKYVDSGVEGDDPYISAETYFFYDANNNLVLETVPESFSRTMYGYNESNLCISRMMMVYDDEMKQWFGNSLETYTYYEDGKLKTSTKSSFDYDGNLEAAKVYMYYTYDASGNLVKEEQRQIGTDAVATYHEYMYENGHLVQSKGYRMSGGDATLTTGYDYTYNPDGTLAEKLHKELVFTVDKDNLTNRDKEVYTYTGGTLSQTIVYVPKTSDYSIWVYSKKYNYKVDPASGQTVSMTYATAKNNMQTGEFLNWKQMTRTEYTFSNSLSAQRTPANLAYRMKGAKLMLGWDAPKSTTGLTGYNIYKDYVLLATVAAGETGYADPKVKEGTMYDYFVQSVYNDSIQNISSVVAARAEAGEAENPWKMTLEQKYTDSGVEGDDPYINSEIYYFYDRNNELAVSATPEDMMRSSYKYNSLGWMREKVDYYYNEESGTWEGTNRLEYTYYPDGKLKMTTAQDADWETGEFMAPGMYTLYTYGSTGELVRKEDRTYEGGNLISYVAYTYENGLKTVEKVYVVDGQNETLNEEITFGYNEDKTLSQTVDRMLQASVDPTKLTNVKKEVYTYENGILKEMTVYLPKSADNEDWIFNQKYNYRFDPESKQLLTSILFLADINVDSGEFIKWNQVTRTEYSYTDQLGENKMPGSIEGTADGSGIHLTWNAPADNTGLTAYNIFRNYQLLETIAAGKTGYTDVKVKNEVTYDYFVQPVYHENVLLNITPVISVKGMTVGIREQSVMTAVYGVAGGIEILSDGLQKAEVYSADGTLISVRQASGNKLMISGMEKGIYLVNVTSRNGIYRQKVSVR